MKTFLTLTLVGLLLAGFAVGAIVDPGGDPTQDGLVLGVGLWLTGVGIALRDVAP